MAISFIYVLGYDGIMDDNSMIVVNIGQKVILAIRLEIWLWNSTLLAIYRLGDLATLQPVAKPPDDGNTLSWAAMGGGIIHLPVMDNPIPLVRGPATSGGADGEHIGAQIHE